MIKVYIIGSLSQESQIKKFAKKLSSIGNDVKYVFSQPDKDFQDLVTECFDYIEWADKIYAILKNDGSIGKGTAYEIEYAKRLKKQIILIDTNNCIHLKINT